MKPRRTVRSNQVFRLPGGTEDNDLWVERTSEEGAPVTNSVWVPTDDERRAIMTGSNLELTVWGDGHPPVGLRVTNIQVGRLPPGSPAKESGQ